MGSSSKHPSKAKKTPKQPLSKEAELLKYLEQELLESNDFFDMLVDMIPSKIYISGKSGDDYNPKYFKGVSEDSKEARKVAAKAAKRRKLDPATTESTVTKKTRMEVEKEEQDSDNDDSNNADDTPMELESSEDAPVVVPTTEEAAATDVPVTGLSRIEALRAKLHAKIAEKQGNRPASAEAVSKRAARRAEKNRRKEDAMKRGKNTNTESSNKKSAITNTAYKVPSATPDPMQDLQQIDFGRLAGLNDAALAKKNYMESNKALSNLSKGKNLHKLLADAEAKRQKLEDLKKSDVDTDKEKAAAMQWVDTFKEADGIRVKDDPAKLKKAIKRKAASKSKSQKAWKTRTDQQSDATKTRLNVRQHNLKQRTQGGSTGANLSKKKVVEPKVDPEKGRRLSRAGFEGRKTDFINSPKEAPKKSKHQQ